MILFSLTSEARERNREMRRDHPQRRGNEQSERVRELTVGPARYGGNGCPEGTMQVVFAPDNLSFAIIFDQFIAEVSERKQKRDVMICDASIPIQIPDNMQMEIIRVDIRGYAALPETSRAALESTFNFRGSGGDGDRMNLRFRFNGPLADEYFISSHSLDDEGEPEESERSPCGGKVQLRIKNRLQVVSRHGRQAAVTLDSIDGQNNAVYHMNWRACDKKRRQSHRKDPPWH